MWFCVKIVKNHIFPWIYVWIREMEIQTYVILPLREKHSSGGAVRRKEVQKRGVCSIMRKIR